tara:strand:+ start:3576 stop:3719 length:144 start_codon:yes stop_codon:yes gene_type:complete
MVGIIVGAIVAVGQKVLAGLPPGIFYRVTESSDLRVTEDGKNNRITE